MNERKQQKYRKEIDKAVANIMKYGEKEPWAERQGQYFSDMLMNVADRFGVPVNEFGQTLEDHGYMSMVFGYLFELFATSCWDDEEVCMIEEYVKRRGWREAPHGKRYLNAMAKSEASLWEIINVKAGHWVELRPFNTTIDAIRVYERSGSEKLRRWDCVAARVVLLDGKYGFTGGILPFSPDQTREAFVFIEHTRTQAVSALKQIRIEDADCNWSDEEIEQLASAESDDQFPELLYSSWASQTYIALTQSMPTLVNRDGHELQRAKVRFPIHVENVEVVATQLHSASQLDFNEDTQEWVWLDSTQSVGAEFGATIMGQISIADDNLIAVVNSAERANTIQDYLKTVLGELIGDPISVYESQQSMMMKQGFAAEESGSDPIDSPELMTAFLDQHYRKILDQPIPALNNLTPRECAAIKEQSENLIQWLKGVENSTAKAENLAHYNFRWMWDELGIEYVD